MKIAIISDHNFPIPYKTHTGQICILDLAIALKQLGHDVHLFAPQGTTFDNLYPIKCAYGKANPTGSECEFDCFHTHRKLLQSMDIVHDFSITKKVSQSLNRIGYNNTCQTLLGGPWLEEQPPRNLIVWTKSHRDRVLRGATDYEGTNIYNHGGPNGSFVKDAHIVNGGIDTGFYCPDKYEKEDIFLWMNQWTPVKGYIQAIEIGKFTGKKVVLAGSHPDYEVIEFHRKCAQHAAEMVADLPNVSIEYLPPDPDHHLAKRELMRRAKALLYTVVFHEPFGLSQAEALACGTPIIGNNLGSIPEVVCDGKTGFVATTVADYIRAIDNIDKIDPVECRKNATKRFDRKVFAKNCLKEYQQIIEGNTW